MATSENVTASQLTIQGREALAYVRDCSADPFRLAKIFSSDASYNESDNSVSLPPLHEFYENDDAEEFVERLRRLGFLVSCYYDATYIRWRSTVDFPNSRQAADRTADYLQPLVDKCIRETKHAIEAEIAKHKFSTVIRDIMQYDADVRIEVTIFLQNMGYQVTKYYECYGDEFHSTHIGYTVSWHPPKTIRDMNVIPWWKFWRK